MKKIAIMTVDECKQLCPEIYEMLKIEKELKNLWRPYFELLLEEIVEKEDREMMKFADKRIK